VTQAPRRDVSRRVGHAALRTSTRAGRVRCRTDAHTTDREHRLSNAGHVARQFESAAERVP
jgi:hypothetical protein